MTVPTATDICLDRFPALTRCHSEDQFSIRRVECTQPHPEPIAKSSSVPALLVSVSLSPQSANSYRLWIDGKLVPAREVPSFRSNVIELGAQPTIWSGGAYRYVHFNVRRSALDEVASELGYERVGGVRTVMLEEDLVLAQIARSALNVLDHNGDGSPLALDDLELVLAAHTLQRYGGVRPKHARAGTGLPTWKQHRATELLREHLDGSLRLADVARECALSVSHFARGFKVSFGVSPHRWLTERRIERAQQLLAHTGLPLVEIAIESGFKDQVGFTRTFRRVVGMAPGRWRREHAVR